MSCVGKIFSGEVINLGFPNVCGTEIAIKESDNYTV